MATAKSAHAETADRPEQASAVRASISFPPDIEERLDAFHEKHDGH